MHSCINRGSGEAEMLTLASGGTQTDNPLDLATIGGLGKAEGKKKKKKPSASEKSLVSH